MTVLSSLRIVEFEGLGPGPFCGMLLADLGADVILIERAGGASAGPAAVFKRGKRSISLDLKNPEAVSAVKKIVAGADGLIEGMRPGVMERLGLGPDVLCTEHPALVYGRLTGWGQTGPLSAAAGHDVNYAALSGAAWYSGQWRDGYGAAPAPPPTLVGDVGGGALYLAIGILAGVMRARETGDGGVVDAAIVDGSAHMMNLLMSLRAAGGLPDDRGASMLDGAPFYDVYQCRDGGWISVGPLEPKFYALLLETLGLGDDPSFAAQFNAQNWAGNKATLDALFATKTRDEWCALLEGTDACFAPVLSPSEAAEHPHMKARKIYREIDGVLQTAGAPRFDGKTPDDPKPIPAPGAHAAEILRDAGVAADAMARLGVA
ncbi:MAG: CaiB/BaiF CoA-transferase family protein [Pseudomonadota bacterium]